MKFILNPKRLACTVEYESVESAENALLAGSNYKGHEFRVFYTPAGENKLKSFDDYSMDPDVQSELEAMSPKSSKNQQKQSECFEWPSSPLPLP